MLDDKTIGDVSEALRAPVVPVLTFSDVVRDLRGRSPAERAA
jgi:hypothetical protein